MKILKVVPLSLPEVKVLQIQRYVDSRGYFLEVFRSDVTMSLPELPELAHKQIAQINESTSGKNVMRGLHAQCQPNLDKLLRVLKGRIIDVAVDIRPNSPTFGKATICELQYSPSLDFEEIIFIPFGFAHGIVALEDSHIQYFQTGFWSDSGETTINFYDTAIDWSTCDQRLVAKIQEVMQISLFSDKDKKGITLQAWKESPLSEKYSV